MEWSSASVDGSDLFVQLGHVYRSVRLDHPLHFVDQRGNVSLLVGVIRGQRGFLGLAADVADLRGGHWWIPTSLLQPWIIGTLRSDLHTSTRQTYAKISEAVLISNHMRVIRTCRANGPLP